MTTALTPLHTEDFQDYALFVNVMTEITGKHRILAEDPRWIQFFSLTQVEVMMAKPTGLIEFCNRWALHNPITKNFNLFLDQLTSRLKFLAKRRAGSSTSLCQECCTGLFIGTTFLQHLLSNYDIREVKDQLGLAPNWPPNETELKGLIDGKMRDSRTSSTEHFSNPFEIFLNSLISLLDSSNTDLYDVKFFVVECLIVLLSSSMYKTQFLNSSVPEDHNQADIFTQYLYRKSVVEMKISYSIPNDSIFFSKIVSVRLVKSLVNISLEDSRHVHSPQFVEEEQKKGFILPKVFTKIQEEHKKYHQERKATESSPTPSIRTLPSTALSNTSYDQMVILMRKMFFDVLKRIPLPVLQNFISEETSLPVNTSNNSTTMESNIPTTNANNLAHQDDYFFQEIKEIQGLPQHLLRERSCQLLLLLLHQRKLESAASFNPFRQAFNLLVDEKLESNGIGANQDDDSGDIEMLNTKSYSSALSVLKIHVEFPQLIEMLCKLLPNHNFSLLLYSFLQIHSSFTDSLRLTGKTSLVVMKCLEGLYVSCSELNEITKNAKTASMPTSSSHSDSSSYSSSSRSHLLQSIETVERVNDIYLFIINLLIIFQDGSLLNSLVNEKMVVPKWFKERANVEMKLLDFLMISLLKALCFAIFRLQDVYLITNIHAIFMNLVRGITEIHAYTSERIMKTIILLAKRIFQKLQQIGKWSSSMDDHDLNLSRTHSVSVGSLVDLHEGSLSLPMAPPPSLSSTPPSVNSEELGQLHKVYNELSLYKTVILQMLQFSTILLKSRVKENPNFLYAIILQYEVLHRYLLAKVVDSFLYDRITSEDPVTPPPLDTSPRIEYSRYLLSQGHRYLIKIESVRDQKQVQYFTAKEAMKILLAEIPKDAATEASLMTSTEPIDLENRDLAEGEADVFLHYDESQIDSALKEFLKTKYLYEEAENPEEFFLPYVWTNIILTAPELIWKLPNIHHFAGLDP